MALNRRYKIYARVLGAETADLAPFLRDLGVSLTKEQLRMDALPLLKLVLTQYAVGTIPVSLDQVQITEIMQDFGYSVEKESVGMMTFRLKSTGARLARKFEDRVTIGQDEKGLSVEGLKKDTVRIISRMEYRLND